MKFLFADIDECQMEDVKCPLGCVNTIGSYTCAEKTGLFNGPEDDPGSCSEGYKSGQHGDCVG
jgi:hypothetical protein